MKRDLPYVRFASVFEEIDALPHTQGQSAAYERHRNLDWSERCADMGGHVIGPFIVVRVKPRVFGRDAFEKGLKTA
jgi:hypothetical protein